MEVFDLRDRIIEDYRSYYESFLQISDPRIQQIVDGELHQGLLWPDPLVQLNPSFERGAKVAELVKEGVLHPQCKSIFVRDKQSSQMGNRGGDLHLYRHQEQAIRAARSKHNYVLTTGTGSGKSLAYIIPIVNHILWNNAPRNKIAAIVVYPMNALVNSQEEELRKFLCYGFPDGQGPVTFGAYTGQNVTEEREKLMADPPQILLTNYVMLELILTRTEDKQLVTAAKGLQFLVLDELHTYRGRQGADVAMLVRRTRDMLEALDMICVGTSATIASEEGSTASRSDVVANVATELFGATVLPSNVIAETLVRMTTHPDQIPDFQQKLTSRVTSKFVQHPNFESYRDDPLTAWLEDRVGVELEPASMRLVRRVPRSIECTGGLAEELSELTGVPKEQCAAVIRKHLLQGYQVPKSETATSSPFAFKLHQFVSRGDTAYATLEPVDVRHVTVYPQRTDPKAPNKPLYPLYFCRECGQEYYLANRVKAEGGHLLEPVDPNDFSTSPSCYIFAPPAGWTEETLRENMPDHWFDDSEEPTIKRDYRRYKPEGFRLTSEGEITEGPANFYIIEKEFRFCLSCGVSYEPRIKDFTKLSTIDTGGRSSATTVLSLSAIRHLRRQNDLPKEAQKLLSFTDNRQDASLQAGHFNDFIEVGILRAAILKACKDAGAAGLTHDQIVQKTFEALDLPIEQFAADPEIMGPAKRETERALKDVLGYRLYRDLRRGWRVTVPNLEQCGLLEIEYEDLDEICSMQKVWDRECPGLARLELQDRKDLCTVLLDHLRRQLAIKVEYLDLVFGESVKQRASQWLRDEWAFDPVEKLTDAPTIFLVPKPKTGRTEGVFLTPQSAFGKFLRRQNAVHNAYSGEKITLDETRKLISGLFNVLRKGGLIQTVTDETTKMHPGYQLLAASMRWKAGDGSRPYVDRLRFSPSKTAGRPNQFFGRFYSEIAFEVKSLEAHEHTAQVLALVRKSREEQFGEGKLPILYCSPTMELGVDIKQLNVVNLRNVPPTPANYAQRSGRAGRSGQPALVFTYCSNYSSHDRYFFKRPNLMVAGVVRPPAIDLANEDLLRAHLHAIWLKEADLSLGGSLDKVLDVAGKAPSLELLADVQKRLHDPAIRARAIKRAKRILAVMANTLSASRWYTEDWVDRIMGEVYFSFEQSCERWRTLYKSSLDQLNRMHDIRSDASRSREEKDHAKRLYDDAERQQSALTNSDSSLQADFYSYRYFASEGFLPGYSFPRLPLTAFIPSSRGGKWETESLTRPRFLAISEFGPRALVYHEGARYRINKVILPIREGTDNQFLTTNFKVCNRCGCVNPKGDDNGTTLCENCGVEYRVKHDFFRLQNVSTKRVDRINSDEEERMRMGYEIQTAFRFQTLNGELAYQTATVLLDGEPFATLKYGDRANIYRINYGWRNRKEKEILGFMLDTEKGYWARNPVDEEAEDGPQEQSAKVRVIPYVEDTKNMLLMEFEIPLSKSGIFSVMAALKQAIQITYQLEENELAVTVPPDDARGTRILFYEAAEGGAGVLRRIVQEPSALLKVARNAIDVCHYDPDTGGNYKRGRFSKEDCALACYDCLMTYGNQRDHKSLDRHAAVKVLQKLQQCTVGPSPVRLPRAELVEQLLRCCQNDLERDWVRYLDTRGYHLPNKAQHHIPDCNLRADFFYESKNHAIFVDGPMHREPDVKRRDAEQEEAMLNAGIGFVRFKVGTDWDAIIANYPNLFGSPK